MLARMLHRYFHLPLNQTYGNERETTMAWDQLSGLVRTLESELGSAYGGCCESVCILLLMGLVLTGIAPSFACVVLLLAGPSFVCTLCNTGHASARFHSLAAESAAKLRDELNGCIQDRGRLRAMQPAGGYNLWHRRRFALAIDRFNSLQAAAESAKFNQLP